MLPSEIEAAVVETARNRYWREGDARLVLAALSDSGRSVFDFAREFGLSVARLHRWKRKLQSSPGEGGELTTGDAQFHPVRVVVRGEAGGGDAIELVLRGGHRVAIRPGFDEATLARLLRTLSSSVC